MDLPVEEILGLDSLIMEEERRVNLLNLWRLIVFRKRALAREEPLLRTAQS